MIFEKGDKVTGMYLGRYDFAGIIWHTEASSKGQNIYVDLERPIFVGEFINPRTSIFIDTGNNESKVKKTLDNL